MCERWSVRQWMQKKWNMMTAHSLHAGNQSQPVGLITDRYSLVLYLSCNCSGNLLLRCEALVVLLPRPSACGHWGYPFLGALGRLFPLYCCSGPSLLVPCGSLRCGSFGSGFDVRASDWVLVPGVCWCDTSQEVLSLEHFPDVTHERHIT